MTPQRSISQVFNSLPKLDQAGLDLLITRGKKFEVKENILIKVSFKGSSLGQFSYIALQKGDHDYRIMSVYYNYPHHDDWDCQAHRVGEFLYTIEDNYEFTAANDFVFKLIGL